MHPGTVLALVVRRAELHQHRIGGAGPDTLLHPHQPVHPQVERRRHPDASARRRVAGHRRDDGGAPVPDLAHVPGEQHRVLVAGVDVEGAVDGGVQVRGLFGEPVAGALVERTVHAHAVAPGDEVGVRLRAPGLDALGHARRSASPPTSCSMLSDRSSRAKASCTGRKSRFETGSVTGTVTGTARATVWGSGSGGGGSASELVTVATGCAGVGVAQGWVSIMCVPAGSGP